MNRQQDFKSSDYGVDFGSLAKLFSEGQNTRILAAKQQDEINNAKLLSQAIKLNTSKDNNIDLNKALFDYTNAGGNTEQGLKTLLGLHSLNTASHDPLSLMMQREALKDAREEKRLARQEAKDELQVSDKLFDLANKFATNQISPDTFGSNKDQDSAKRLLLEALQQRPDKQKEIMAAASQSISKPSIPWLTDTNFDDKKFGNLFSAIQ